jgi:hypothetical protein
MSKNEAKKHVKGAMFYENIDEKGNPCGKIYCCPQFLGLMCSVDVCRSNKVGSCGECWNNALETYYR